MNVPNLKTYLEVATNAAVLLVALVVLGNFAWVHLAKQPMPRAEGGLRKGDAFSLLPSVDYGENSRTLIIAMSSKCERCSESLPFFRQLLEANKASSDLTRIVAIFPETAEEVSRYISEQQLTMNSIPGINYKALNLPGTPTEVLLDKEGKVLNFWIGKPSKNAEQEILEAVTHKS
jgi:hypothetical protein